jgi:hypothetical protein
VPFPGIQLLKTIDALVHVELQTAVKLPPSDMYPGEHSSVQTPPGIAYDALQLDEFVWPGGKAGNPKHAGEYADTTIPSICANGENSFVNVCDCIWSCSMPVPAGATTSSDPVCHTMLLGMSLTPEPMFSKKDAPIWMDPNVRNLICTTRPVSLPTAPAANPYTRTSPAATAGPEFAGKSMTWLRIGA